MALENIFRIQNEKISINEKIKEEILEEIKTKTGLYASERLKLKCLLLENRIDELYEELYGPIRIIRPQPIRTGEQQPGNFCIVCSQLVGVIVVFGFFYKISLYLGGYS